MRNSGLTITGGVFQASIEGGDGNDAFTISGGRGERFGGIGHGVLQASVNGGNGDDAFTITGSGGSGGGGGVAEGYGVSQASINGGSGNDSFTISGDAGSPSTGAAYGVYQSSVNGGDGDDSFTITGYSRAGSPQIVGYGVAESAIYGESGNDFFAISGTTFDIKDVLISGGEGNDTFDTGIGQGTVDGGSGGNDLIFLNFFDAQTMSIKVLGKNDLQITGTVDGQGNSLSWTQNILNMEQFQVGSNLFTTPVAVADF